MGDGAVDVFQVVSPRAADGDFVAQVWVSRAGGESVPV
jgi:hypothetical protein